MDLSSIFAYIVKIAILLMSSHIEIPDEIRKSDSLIFINNEDN